MRLVKFILLIIINNLYELSIQQNISEFIYFNDSSLDVIFEFSDSSAQNYIGLALEFIKLNDTSSLIYLLKGTNFSEEHIKIVDNLLKKILSNCTYTEDLKKILTTYKDKLNKLIDLIIKNKLDNDFLDLIIDIINKDKPIIDLIFNTGKIFPDIFNLSKIIIKGNDTLDNEIEKFKEFMIQNYDKIFDLIINIYKCIRNDIYVAKNISYFITNNIDISHNIFDILKEGNIFQFIADHITNNNLFSVILKSLAEDKALLFNLFEKFANKSSNLLLNLASELKDINHWNQTILFVPKFLVNDEMKGISSDIVINFLKYALKINKFYDFLTQIIKEIIRYKRKKYDNNIKEGLSEECLTFLDYIVFGDGLNGVNGDRNITKYYLYKFFFETVASRSDILIYEDCLDKIPSGGEITLPNDNNLSHSSSYIISLVDLSKRNNIIKNSTHFENYHFLIAFCVPQAVNNIKNKFTSTNNETKQLYCNQSDYNFLIKAYLKLGLQYINEEDIDVKTIEINRYNEIIKFSDHFRDLIPSFISLIPFLIFIFLVIYRNIFIRSKKDIKMIDQNKYSQIKKDDDLNNKKKEEIKPIKKVKLVPRWYKILNEFFDIIGHLKELFDSNQNENNDYNNIGMNYINFLISVSIILTIFGQLYLILFNVPINDFGEYQFYELYHNILYIFPLVGLRYSPRVLFSCSGYTLSFKYLSYIDHNKHLYYLKFVFHQLYKFLILILFMLYLRNSLYYIMCLFFGIKPMWKLFYFEVLLKPKKIGDFIVKLLNLNISKVFKANSKNKEYNLKYSQDLFDYYWISFNEIFFFMVGIILLTLGYKFKIRIDIGIIILTLIIFILKIVLYIIFMNKIELYTTLYYYLFDYGYSMINPLFNLPYFLIGMYFGLMNYSIREGINDQNYFNIYKQLRNNDENTKDNLVEEEYENEIDDNSEDYKKNNKNRLSINETFNSSKNNILISENPDGYLKEIKLKPYLYIPVNIIKWHRNHNFKWFFGIILFVISSIVLLFMLSYIIINIYYTRILDEEDIYLEKSISNPLLNILYLIDIEFVVFFIQWGFFILFMKGFTYDLFKSNFWEFLSKPYFSFNMISNPVILFIFYESETVVKINIFNLFLYFFIDIIVIIICTIIVYIFFELPMKKLFKYMFNKKYQILDLTEDCIEEEEEEDEDEDEAEDDDKDDDNDDVNDGDNDDDKDNDNDEKEKQEKQEKEENKEYFEERKKENISML